MKKRVRRTQVQLLADRVADRIRKAIIRETALHGWKTLPKRQDNPDGDENWIDLFCWVEIDLSQGLRSEWDKIKK